MIHKNNLDNLLFSRASYLISDKAIKRLDNSWHGVFRRVILELLPVEVLEKNFDPVQGRPTKELYSICGLILIMQFFGWDVEETSLKYMTDISLQYALNVEEDFPELSDRTIQRYLKLAREDELAVNAMHSITLKLAEEMNLDLSLQRVDSTHVFCNMAKWSRRKLLFNIIQRFLKQLKRHLPFIYYELNNELLERYKGNNGWIFADNSSRNRRSRGKTFTNEEELGFDMQTLIRHFSSNEKCCNMSSYKDLVRVFSEQFINDDGLPKLNPNPGGKILINPSDEDAEIGHKGIGYQVQISETCSDENDVQLITSAIPQGASQSDMASFVEVVEDLKEQELVPEKIIADGGYGSDENYVYAQENDIELIAPTASKIKNKVTLDDCEFDEENIMLECPAGIKPMNRTFKYGKGRAVYHITTCDKCQLKDICQSTKRGKQNREFRYSLKDLRNVTRRKYQKTDEYKKSYRKRSPIEGLNGRLKQYTPLKRLKIRGKKAVNHSILSILTMHNIMQLVRHAKILNKKASAAAICSILMHKNSIFAKNHILRAA